MTLLYWIERKYLTQSRIYMCSHFLFDSAFFVAIERNLSARSSREELIRRGILKDVDEEQGRKAPANTGPVVDGGVVLGERTFSVLVTVLY